MNFKLSPPLLTGLLTLAIQFTLVAASDDPKRPFVHPLFSNHAVLQRDQRLPIWGWTDPNATVTVSMDGKTRSTTATADGRWEVRLGPFRAGGPHSLSITGPRNLTLTDILVGDVWLCSGQSNMEWPVAASNNADDEIARASYPRLRLFTVPKRIAYQPQSTLDSQWQLCTPDTVRGFSAVGYFFGRELQTELGVPIGLINSSWGGTVAEAWTSTAGLEPLGDFNSHLAQLREVQAAIARGDQDQMLDQRNPNQCTVLYNGMIAPLLPAALRGAIWYQGESNADRARQYQNLLPAMIQDWRSRFSSRNLGFHIVSLANFLQTSPNPTDHDWAELREAQALTAQKLRNCGLALAIDIGEANDIHPRNKQEVGRRLALSALGVTYGRKVAWSGPWYRSMKITSQGVRLRFNHVDRALVTPSNAPLTGFAIAGQDQKFVWANAVIDGNTVLVSSPEVPDPVAVRYAWDVNPVCNLYNRAGLPAVPFRTDTWTRTRADPLLETQ